MNFVNYLNFNFKMLETKAEEVKRSFISEDDMRSRIELEKFTIPLDSTVEYYRAYSNTLALLRTHGHSAQSETYVHELLSLLFHSPTPKWETIQKESYRLKSPNFLVLFILKGMECMTKLVNRALIYQSQCQEIKWIFHGLARASPRRYYLKQHQFLRFI